MSATDKAILNSIFNPLLPVGECVYEEDIPTHLKDENLEVSDPSSEKVKFLESAGVKAAEEGKVEESVKLFTEAICLNPKKPSCYNNRAQALRLFGKNEESICDLNMAIKLSNGKGKSACQAYIQRAMLHRLQGDDEQAKKDFQMAADMGSNFAKVQIVQMNPYAALCNKMLHDVFTKLQNGENY